MKQSPYLFTAGVTVTKMVSAGNVRGTKSFQTWDSCATCIVFADGLEQAQETFEKWCAGTESGDEPSHTEIKKIVGAQLIEELLAESGGKPLEQEDVSRRLSDLTPQTDSQAAGESAEPGPDAGYWIDAERVVRPETAHCDLESFIRALPEEIRSAVNWAPETKFLFLVTCVSPPVVPPQLDENFEDPESPDGSEQAAHESPSTILDDAVAQLPEMREKEAAALVEARNAVVAAWLWRKFAANTRLAPNEIFVSPCCEVINSKTAS